MTKAERDKLYEMLGEVWNDVNRHRVYRDSSDKPNLIAIENKIVAIQDIVRPTHHPALNTVRVRVAVVVGKDGKWSADGASCTKDDNEALGWAYEGLGISDLDGSMEFFLTADLPIPDPVEIEAEVEDA